MAHRQVSGSPPDRECGRPYSCCRCAKPVPDRKSTRLNSSHVEISYAVFCLKKKMRSYVSIYHLLSHHIAHAPTTGIILHLIRPMPLPRFSTLVQPPIVSSPATSIYVLLHLS